MGVWFGRFGFCIGTWLATGHRYMYNRIGTGGGRPAGYDMALLRVGIGLEHQQHGS